MPNCAKLCQSRDNIIILIIIFINQSNVQNYTKFTITCDPAKEIIPVRWSGVLKNELKTEVNLVKSLLTFIRIINF